MKLVDASLTRLLRFIFGLVFEIVDGEDGVFEDADAEGGGEEGEEGGRKDAAIFSGKLTGALPV